MILHSSNLRETRICHNKGLGDAEVVVVFNDQSHYNGTGKGALELASGHWFHSIMCQFCNSLMSKLSLIMDLFFSFSSI